ncbi:molybdate ABC transporter, ATPase subunit [Desulfobulbus propionicus DSM 2032]|uniref:Molybdate ABC transporter, ATPase subunit n=1 Tax=Desulfobulbus propionicus (strain ATCC 33891 / DSM 2032 / VKM B-1956 / 1pr3) TaxID=577650 RepID=A0A7U4DMT9_DESPD|nr:molybdenum ABC transporter ATP-binding protein [Desulfobulbus propionicus]ADW16426.1 molybdate ABC transporter, ATPase subunit [Desulfobulbus propionicus DSM 2032]
MHLDVSLRKQQGTFQFTAEFSLSGQRIGLFGPSGSGKSTLMHLLAGLLKPDSGSIHLDETVLFDSARGINLPPEQRRIGVVFQHAHLFPHMSVRRNLLYGWRRTPEAERHVEPEAIIEVLHLAHLLDRGVNLLSGGERQRVALGRTILSCPRLILMDEPLTGLDEELKFQIMPYLNSVFSRFDIPLLFISHSLLEMRLMTEQVLVVEQGEVKRQMATEELAQSAWAASRQGYVNLLRLGRPQPQGDLWAYQWGDVRLVLTEQGENEENVFELDAREILLFKRHPEATSARNLLPCTVRKLFTVGNRVRVELQCGSQTMTVQIVPESMRELALETGKEVVAVIKASAFRKLL